MSITLREETRRGAGEKKKGTSATSDREEKAFVGGYRLSIDKRPGHFSKVFDVFIDSVQKLHRITGYRACRKGVHWKRISDGSLGNSTTPVQLVYRTHPSFTLFHFHAKFDYARCYTVEDDNPAISKLFAVMRTSKDLERLSCLLERFRSKLETVKSGLIVDKLE